MNSRQHLPCRYRQPGPLRVKHLLRSSLPNILSLRRAALGIAAASLWGCAATGSPPPGSGMQNAPAQAAVNTPPPPSLPVPQATVPEPAPKVLAPLPGEANAKASFVSEMSTRGLDPSMVAAVLQNAKFSETVARLVLPPSSPSVRSWPRYRERFVEQRRIKEGLAFKATHADSLSRTEVRYGVPASVIVAIIGVETFYGRVTGNFRIVDALSTLAFDYPVQARSDRSAFFREQLAQFLIWCKESGVDPLTIKGSYAGAIGLPQFMPGSIRSFAVDGDGDGKIDLRLSPEDAIASVANFLVEHGWQRDQPIFLPLQLPADPASLVDGGLKPTLSWVQLEAAGARAPRLPDSSDVWKSWPLAVVDLFDGATGTTEYRTAAPNFFALTQYNRSYFYATAVTDLAVELERQDRVAKRSVKNARR